MPLAHTTLIIIIAVSAAVGGLLLVLILYRIFRRPVQVVPLPPKQELARYREQQLTVPESRPQTWYDAGFLSTSSYVASKSSLLPPDSRGGSPFRHSSLNMSESPSEDISHLSGTAPMDTELQLPNLPFDASSTSLSTAETAGSSSPPLDSSFSHTPRQSRSSSSTRPHRPRPLSVGSTGSSAISRNSRNTIRGMPHGPHSQVQIVLPAPLAFNDRTPYYESPSRLSIVDQWAPVAVRSEGNNPIPRHQRRSFSNCTRAYIAPLSFH
ncbi:hypothetical protein DFH07DRAFT_189075 [Mycena maculata]|uniref:Uncharacterized protein n=1 Tax=Mycena maculata TaxID=230809 RepID=A0AAD7KDQ9_9AGAR|nr:hypothetical protein DFH07DRAFT_189075 [Mycena maculata]